MSAVPPTWSDALQTGLHRALLPGTALEERRARRLAAELARRVSDPEAPEASLRLRRGDPPRGGRMMLERAPEAVVQLIAEAFEVPMNSTARDLLRAARDAELPLIAGWDAGRPDGPAVKVYANAADASEARRRAVARAVGLPEGAATPDVVGLNLSVRGVEAKGYFQRPGTAEPPAALPDTLRRLPVAAWVDSFDVRSGELLARSTFLAPPHGSEAAVDAALRDLLGASWEELRQALPFPAGPLRQLGVDARGVVTCYAKPAWATLPLHELVPQAVFRTEGAEVGLYLEPSATTPRAYLRTDHHAITFRTREGQPAPAELEHLGRWVEAAVRRYEATRAPLELTAPPSPWRSVPMEAAKVPAGGARRDEEGA